MVNDGSTDFSSEIIKKYAEKSTKIRIVNKENGGLSSARNVGLDIATGQYVTFLDSDDLWMSDKLEKQIAFMERTGAKFSATGYLWMDENGNDLHTG